MLLINGRFDFYSPVESSQAPFFRLLGAPEADKKWVLLDAGHVPPNDLMMKEILDWFDRYLGPVH